MDTDWKMAIIGGGLSVVTEDGIDVWQCTSLDEAFITAFWMYSAFNIAYPTHLRMTLTFLQRHILNIRRWSTASNFPLNDQPFVLDPHASTVPLPKVHSKDIHSFEVNPTC